MKRHWLKRLRLVFRITSQTKSIRDNIHSMVMEGFDSQYYEENKRKLFEKIIRLIDTLQELFSSNGEQLRLSDYEELSPEDVNLSLAELLVLFRRALTQLQETPSHVQHTAIEILYSYFTELQGLYDLIFVRRYETDTSHRPLSLSTIEDHHKRYFRCFTLSDQTLDTLKKDGMPAGILIKLETLKSQEFKTEENFVSELEAMIGTDQLQQHKATLLKHAQMPQESDPIIYEYKSIKYKNLMNMSLSHHIHVILLDLLHEFVYKAIKEFLQGKPRCRKILDPEEIATIEQLRACLLKHPLSETAKLGVALHRHTMRVFDILFTRFALRLGRPIFELLVLGTWSQTVKDHIIPGIRKPSWQTQHLYVEQEVTDKNIGPGTIRMSSAFFMQPRVKFHLERFLIFKIRTMTVGDVVRTTEFGDWLRQNSPDEFLQFFNIAMSDMGGVGIRAMPEHEIMETEETLWLYIALMNFVPVGMTSPGSIEMRKEHYSLTKAQQLFREIRYYDPRFKGSSGLITDIKTVIRSLLVLNQGRVGKALEKTESFEGKKRGF